MNVFFISNKRWANNKHLYTRFPNNKKNFYKRLGQIF